MVYNLDFLRSWNHIFNITAVQSTWKGLKSFINNVLCPQPLFHQYMKVSWPHLESEFIRILCVDS